MQFFIQDMIGMANMLSIYGKIFPQLNNNTELYINSEFLNEDD